MTRKTTLIAVLATGLLAMAAISVAVEAKPGDNASSNASDRRDQPQEKAQALKEKARDDAIKVRRHVLALEVAIKVHERLLNRTNSRIAVLEGKVAAGNLTGNQTQALENRIAHLKDRAAKLTDKIQELKDKFVQIKARWQEARSQAQLRRGQDDLNGEGNGTEDTSSSSTTSSSPASTGA